MSSSAAERILEGYSEVPTLSPPLKWAGGKRWLVPEIKRIYETHRDKRLVEPFVGGMAVALALQPKSALLADINSHLINFYVWLRQGLQIEIEVRNERELFFAARHRFNQLVQSGEGDSKTAAMLFYYLNRTCFNGLCRFNSKGEFNVPFGQYAKINYASDFREYSAMFKNWEFRCLDFEMIEVGKSDFLYVDPPYDVEFTRYSKDDFTFEDQKRLVKWLQNLSCPIVASNQATARILKLYEDAGFVVKQLPAPRRISCNGDRTPAMEMLAVKNLPGAPNFSSAR